jgi:hypothetical protein
MSTEQVVAAVNAIEGQAFAQGPDGTVRPLQAGDALYDGEILAADPGSNVMVAPDDGSPAYRVDGPIQLAMSDDNREGEVPDMTPEDLANIIESILTKDDLDPPSIGPGAGGGSRPHSFVLLERIVESVEPMPLEFGASTFVNEGPVQHITVSFGGGGSNGSEGEPPPPPDDGYSVVEGSLTAMGSVLANDGAGAVTVGKVILANGAELDVPATGLKFVTELGGIVVIHQDGTFEYAAPVRYNSGAGTDAAGPDTDHFQYRYVDADGNLSGPATVNIDILDTVPVAVDDNYAESAFNPTSRLHGNVMENDELSQDYILKAGKDSVQNIVWLVRAGDGGAEIAVPVGKYSSGGPETIITANGGKVWINQDGTFEYSPPERFSGEDSFQYRLNDADGSPSGWATVTFHVPAPPTNPPPPAVEDNYDAVEGSLTMAVGNILANDNAGAGAVVGKVVINGVDYDVPATGLKFVTELGGIVVVCQDGTFDYAAPVRYNNGAGTDADGPDTDRFQYRYVDADGNLSGVAAVKIKVIDTVPVAVADNYAESDFNPTSRLQGDVMANDVLSQDWVLKAGGDSVQNIVSQVRAGDGATEFSVSANPYDSGGSPVLETAHGGRVWINQDGKFEYAPAERFSGEDSFQYQLNDADGSTSDWMTVTFNVPSPPVVVTGGLGHDDLYGTDGTADVFKWSLADLGDGSVASVTNTITGFNAAEGDRLDLRDLLQDGDNFLFDADHLSISANSGNTTIVVSPVGTSAPELNIVLAGVDLVGDYEGQNAIDELIKQGNLVDK